MFSEFSRPSRRSPFRKVKELRGHGTWKRWRKEIYIELDRLGLRHLLSASLRPLSSTEQYYYAKDQQRAVKLILENVSETILQRLWNCGWEVSGASLQATLALLEALLAEPEQQPQQSHETHRDLVDLGRISLTGGPNGIDQFLSDAQQCHLRLLARYGNGNGSVEELLEHMFTSSVMEGLKSTKPREYTEWMGGLDRGVRFRFLTDLIQRVQAPRIDDTQGDRYVRPTVDPALIGELKGPREWDLHHYSRRAYKRRRNDPNRYRGRAYPDKYRPGCARGIKIKGAGRV